MANGVEIPIKFSYVQSGQDKIKAGLDKVLNSHSSGSGMFSGITNGFKGINSSADLAGMAIEKFKSIASKGMTGPVGVTFGLFLGAVRYSKEELSKLRDYAEQYTSNGSTELNVFHNR